jgi:hypothetical protein
MKEKQYAKPSRELPDGARQQESISVPLWSGER